ncbi:unannotated protein [freshwater metagenome]|uniref:Unannotated protein n=1 Tax=freshwater metagenome TaxID=449393 RepID=A0A6J7JDI0_9ZZZZ
MAASPASSGPALAEPGRTRTGLLLGAALSPIALGVSTTAIALPAISAHMGLSQPQAAWILAAYLLAQSVCVSLFGRLADLRGLRLTFSAAAVLLLVGSAACAISGSFATIVAGRLLQGAGAGAITVSLFGVVGTRFSPSARPKVLGAMTALVGIVSGSGTLIGGVVTDAVSWRAVVALPALAVLVVPACRALCPRTPAASGRIDGTGALLVAAITAVAVVLLESPSTHPGTTLLIVLLIVGALCCTALVRHVRRVPLGFIPLELARDRRFIRAGLAGLSIYGVYVAMLFAVPLILTESHGWSASRIGLVLLPAAIFGAAAAWVVGALSTRVDPFRITAVLAGFGVIGALVAGIGNGAAVPCIIGLALTLSGVTGANVSLVARVPMMAAAEVRSVATGLFTLIFQIGGALGSAMVAGLDDPLGDPTALACVAILPLAGVWLALSAGRVGRERDELEPATAS